MIKEDSKAMATNSEINKRYGNLLDGIQDSPQTGYRTQQEIEKEVHSRYGNLMDCKGMDNALYDNLMEIENASRRVRRQREEASRLADIRRQVSAEQKRVEEQEDIDNRNAFLDSLIEKNEAEKKARLEAEEQRRIQAEKKQNVLDSLRRMKDIGDRTSEMLSQTNAMLKRDAQRTKEREEQMEWYRRQQRR